jgi:ATPase subunit of ABC transporter with duplicated ATPase domains
MIAERRDRHEPKYEDSILRSADNTNRSTLSNTVEVKVQEGSPTRSPTAVCSICGCMMFEGDDALRKISGLLGGEQSRVVPGKILTPAPQPSSLKWTSPQTTST